MKIRSMMNSGLVFFSTPRSDAESRDGGDAYDTPQDFLRKLRAHKKRQDPFASDSDDALPPKCDKCNGPHLTDDCPPSPKNGTRRRSPARTPSIRLSGRRSPPKKSLPRPMRKKRSRRRGPGRPGKGREAEAAPEERQRSPPKQEEEEERRRRRSRVERGVAGCFLTLLLESRTRRAVEGELDSSRAARARARASSDDADDEDEPPRSPPPRKTRAGSRRSRRRDGPRALSPKWRLHPIAPEDGKVLPEPRHVRVKPESWHQAADEDQFFDSENFDRWSDRGLLPYRFLLKLRWTLGALAYLREGDSSDLCGSRASEAHKATKKALKACKGADGSRASVARELWLYLAARAGRRGSSTSCASLSDAAAERDVAAALQDLEVVTLAAAAAGARACSRAKAPKKPPSQDVGPMAQGSDDPMSESSSDSSEDEGDDVELKKRLVKCRSERAAALEAWSASMGWCRALDKDDALLSGRRQMRPRTRWIGTSSRGAPRGIRDQDAKAAAEAAPRGPARLE